VLGFGFVRKRLGLAAALPALAACAGLVAAPADAASRTKKRSVRATAPAVLLPAGASEWDLAVGRAAQNALGRSQGAVVAMDPYTGRVHALVNPALGTQRAFQPCSVFKIVVGIAGLSEGVINPQTTFRCDRGCWSWAGHGAIDLRRALAVSCNPFFERVGEALGYDTVQRYARLLGLGEVSGINLTGEAKGKVPLFVSPSAVGHLSSHAAGIETSAVQLAVLVSATVNGGVVLRPQVTGPEGMRAQERWRLPESTRLDGLAEGFVAAVNEGSASAAFDADVAVAGKTGTCAQLGWFASYAPAERPELVVVVFLRHGSGHGASAVAGRLFRELMGGGAGATAAGMP
jgi:cell division protein FtsI/penicillin-binding protein 2